MPQAPLSFSIVLLTYNQQDYVRDAVTALLAQDCAPVELFLSDDCSTDDTFAVMQDAVKDYEGPHRIVLNRNAENLGVNRHIKRSYDMCSGEVIIATSGDDICDPHRAARTIEVFERDRPWLLFSQARVTTLDGVPLPPDYRGAQFYHTRDPMVAAKSMSLYLGATCAWHKDMFRKYGPIDDPLCYEDLVHGFRAALEGRVAFVDEELLTYRVGAGVSNTAFVPLSTQDYNDHRLKSTAREIAVFRQRLKDCKTFGLGRDHPIVAALEKRLMERTLRQTFVRDGAMSVLRAGDAPLRVRLGAILYEGHKRRARLRRARKIRGA